MIIRCIPAEKIQDGAIYKRIGDIALCVYIVLNDDGKEFVSAAAKSGMLRLWNKSFEDVYRMAMDNTGDPVIIKMDLVEVANGFFRKIDIDTDVSDQQFVSVTTDTMTNGAAAIFKPGTAEKLLKGFQTDKIYLSFTSVHEVMVHPARDIEPDELKDVLIDTSQSCHTGSDFLTTHIYEYTKEYGFQIAA